MNVYVCVFVHERVGVWVHLCLLQRLEVEGKGSSRNYLETSHCWFLCPVLFIAQRLSLSMSLSTWVSASEAVSSLLLQGRLWETHNQLNTEGDGHRRKGEKRSRMESLRPYLAVLDNPRGCYWQAFIWFAYIFPIVDGQEETGTSVRGTKRKFASFSGCVEWF